MPRVRCPAAEQVLAMLADRLASEPTASLTVWRSMLTNPTFLLRLLCHPLTGGERGTT